MIKIRGIKFDYNNQVFFQFPDEKIIDLTQVKKGVNYAILITTNS